MRSMLCLFIVVLLIVGSTFTTHAQVQDEGLILYFSFDSEKGGTLKDLTGGGNDGTVEDAEIATDEVVHGTGSMLFDNINASVTVESFKALEAYQDNSYLFWLQFTEANSGAWQQIIAKKAPGTDRVPGIWTCDRVPLHIHYRFDPGNGGSLCVGPNGEGDAFEIDKWYHVAGVKEGGNFKFYMDGKVVDNQNVPKEHTQGVSNLYIGKTNYGSALFYIDDFYLYDRALSADEVSDVMDGKLLPVEPKDKLSATWGRLKTIRN